MSRAREAELDLVEVSPNATPPVCKILDYGKFRFQEQKKAAEAKKKQHVVTVKELSFRPRIEDHDYQIKLKKARAFLEEGNKVKINLRFRGREVAYTDAASEIFDRLVEDVSDIGKVDFRSGLEGRFMNMVLSPGAAKKK